MYLGEFRNRIVLQTLGGSIDAGGGQSSTWSGTTAYWSKVENLSGSEGLFGDQLRATNQFRFTIRYNSSLNEKYRIVYSSENYNIQSIKDIDEGKFKYQEIIATKGVAN